MKAVQFDRHGDPAEVLSVRDLPTPVPARGEVLVRMLASPVNPSDLMYVAGQYMFTATEWPATPGFEGLGVVAASGGGVLGWLRKGKRVAVLNDRRGNWGEYAVTTARQVIPVPADIPDAQAASYFVNPATALVMTQSVLKVPAGAWLLQSAAGSELGKMIIRLGKKLGFKTMNVVRRREQVEELKKLGADVVLVESDGPLAEQVKRHVADGVKYAIDPVGGATGSGVVQSLAAGGTCLLYGTLSGEPLRLEARQLMAGDKCVRGFWLGDWAKRQGVLTMLRLIRRIRGLMREGVLTTEVAAEYPLDRVVDAVRHAASPARGGKVLLRIG